MTIDFAVDDWAPDAPYDICIVGAGAAGITLARQYVNTQTRVCLLESGGLDFEEATQNLYEGPNLGMPYYDIVDARLRFFGGTTNIWGGRCIPLDAIDFEKRDWIPHSGWPISRDDLEPFYVRAHNAMGLGAYEYGNKLWQAAGKRPPQFDATQLTTQFWRFDETEEPFGASRCTDIFNAANIDVVLHASVVHIQANAQANSVAHVDIGALNGRRGSVSARHFVLACGGIENARLLLAAQDVEANGIGNRHDQVGRYFMEHQHGRVGQVVTEQPWQIWHQFHKFELNDGRTVAPILLAGKEAQAERSMLNSGLTFKLQRNPDQGLLLNDRLYRDLKHKLPPDEARRRMYHTYRAVRSWTQKTIKPTLSRARARLGLRKLYVMVRAEQAPNPESRVQLVNDKDSLGIPRAALNWQLSALDKATVSALADLCQQEFQRLGLGTMAPAAWLADPSPEWPVDDTVSKHPIAGYHHMGTTRMSADPTTGVVDANCRVHGYQNLFIAGSSVFTTGGWANPTLTILALAYRLADHLGEQLENK